MTAQPRLSDIRPAPRRGLNREEAAIYVGVGTTKFDEMVNDGRMPKPKRVDAAFGRKCTKTTKTVELPQPRKAKGPHPIRMQPLRFFTRRHPGECGRGCWKRHGVAAGHADASGRKYKGNP